MTGQDDIVKVKIRNRIYRTLEADIDDLHVGQARQGDGQVVHGRERPHEAHRQETREVVQEEQVLGLLPPTATRALKSMVPAETLLGTRTSVKSGQAQRGIDVFVVYGGVCCLIIRVFHGIRASDDYPDLYGLKS